MDYLETICAIATPRGDGAVGMLRLSGPHALELSLRASGKVPGDLSPRRMVAARLKDPESGVTLDRVLLCHMAAPASYTGEQVVEVFGHGGQLNMERLLSLFLRLGARLAEPGEFTRRAFLNGRMDLDRAEAVAQVISARSEQALDNAQALLGGALGKQVLALEAELLQLVARLEAAVDFAEDLQGNTELSNSGLDAAHTHALGQIDALAQTYQRAGALEDLSVALIGPANAGKSSLFNQLLGRTRALVDESPGTTRDYLEGEVNWDGMRITLVDTAGSRGPLEDGSTLERRGRKLAAGVLSRCRLLIRVLDLTNGDLPDDGLPVLSPTIPLLLVANKQDIAPTRRLAEFQQSMPGKQIISTSALTGDGVDQLREAIIGQLQRLLPTGETILVTRRRQHEALVRAREALALGQEALAAGLPPELVVEHTGQVLAELGHITGVDAGEAVLDAIFSTFCLGK